MFNSKNIDLNFVDGHFDLGTQANPPTNLRDIIKKEVSVKEESKSEEMSLRSDNKIEARNKVTVHKAIFEMTLVSTKSSNNDLNQCECVSEIGVKQRGMTKSHYIDKNQRKSCNGCHKVFKLKRKPKHCRRCGEVFCLQCVKYKRKLNVLANPDPEGKLRKVCRTCFEEDLLHIGHTRNLIDEFTNERSFAKYSRMIQSRVNSLTTTFWPDQIDIQEECLRLVTGFKEEIRQLGSVNALQALKAKLKTPSWQKSKYWNIEIQSRVCRVCKGDIGIRKSTGNCRVCSLALCRKCSHKELLLYMENVETANDAKIVIIDTPGAPVQEPDISLLLYVCLNCKERISEKQMLDVYWFRHQTKVINICQDIVQADVRFKLIRKKISFSIIKLEDILEKLERNELNSTGKRNVPSDMMTLRSDLTEYEKELKVVRSLLTDTLTKSQSTLLNNFIKGNHDFYLESRYKCRTLSNKLERECIELMNEIPQQVFLTLKCERCGNVEQIAKNSGAWEPDKGESQSLK